MEASAATESIYAVLVKSQKKSNAQEEMSKDWKKKLITLSITFSFERNILITLQDSQGWPYKWTWLLQISLVNWEEGVVLKRNEP